MGKEKAGFTLIELSIVLVIIGLVVGGVLVGQDLIRAAYVRAQISQIEKFNTAVNTFYGKFQALPGDMSNGVAQTFGFSAATHNSSGATSGQGDGNGVIDGGYTGAYTGTVGGVAGQITTSTTAYGETGVFWVDLSSAVAGNLIEGGYRLATEATNAENVPFLQYLPAAKLGGGSYVYVFEINGANYYGIETAVNFGPWLYGYAAITVAQAYSIDKKVDDGFPTTGNVAAMVSNSGEVNWVSGGPDFSNDSYVPSGSLFSGTPGTAGQVSSSTTCFDAPLGADPTYSTEQSGGAGLNCSLIFKFQ